MGSWSKGNNEVLLLSVNSPISDFMGGFLDSSNDFRMTPSNLRAKSSPIKELPGHTYDRAQREGEARTGGRVLVHSLAPSCFWPIIVLNKVRWIIHRKDV